MRDADATGSEKSLRLFVAVELPDDVRRSLAGAIDLLRGVGVDGGLRWVRPEGVHLTLKFLGAVAESRVPDIVAALRKSIIESALAPFELQPYRFGSFHGGRHMPHEFQGARHPYRYNLRVMWLGMQGDTEALAELANRVEGALAPLGYPTEKRPFAAHLTLARVRDDADRATRERLSAAFEPYLSEGTRTGRFRPELVPEFPAFRADRVSLMQSTIQTGGAVYRAIERFALEDKAELGN